MRLAVAKLHNADGESFRAGGMMIQNIAEDDARGSTEDGWNRARALFETLREDELVDPLIAPETLLFRLFHEDGVRMFTPKALQAHRRCSEDRVLRMLQAFPAADLTDMIEPDGQIRVTCEYCSRNYVIAPKALERDTAEG